ncbi:MAG TPA: 2,3-bisphosphoglycerate-independent phosphoglycerate mutase [Vampirovibrionales bacterium]
MSNKKSLLLILDGWGINNNPKESAIAAVQPKFFNSLSNRYPNSSLNACGKEVGLPEGVMGNSEVGHENIGAGRVALQKLTLISETIKDETFFQNASLNQIFNKTKNTDKALHFVGLLSEGDVHSHLGHLYALIEWAEKENINYFVHPIVDGRDDPQKNAIKLLGTLQSKVKTGKIATVCGRYWAMDRDNNWNRVEKYWKLLIQGEGLISGSAVQAIEEAYNRKDGLYEPKEDSDEFVQPTKIQGVDAKVQNGDGIVFFNFRPDRARQISAALTQETFEGFKRDSYPKINYVCLTYYDNSLHDEAFGAKPPLPVAFSDEALPTQDRTLSIGEIVANKGLKQLRIAETEKYRHVTSFFNQGSSKPFINEERILVPSPKVATYDEKPEMSLPEVAKKLVEAIESEEFDFLVANFANADMVGHTGDFVATEEAIKFLDEAIEQVTKACLKNNVSLLITADHGNADQMLNPDGTVRTAHSLNKVPLILVHDELKTTKLNNGALCDIAPTLLELMGLEQPSQMNGMSLIK